MNIQELIQRALSLQEFPGAVETMALVLEVAHERLHQAKLGYTEAVDDAHPPGLLATAAGAYAMSAAGQRSGSGAMPREVAEELCVDQFFKWNEPPKNPHDMLVIAAALIFAELEKMDREKSAKS
jgi:hypothetical protein